MLTLSKFASRLIFSAIFWLIFTPLVQWQSATAQTLPLPPEIEAVIQNTKMPHEAISLYAIEANPQITEPLLSYQALTPRNPASVMKLVTSVAALDLLGPAYTWQTQVFADGPIQGDVLRGNLIIKGGGDPKLVVERLWLLLRRVQGLGIQTIDGDILLDTSAFDLPSSDAAAFDGEPMKPYNAGPDALLINFKSLVMTFAVNSAQSVAFVTYDPPLHGVTLPSSVPLSNGNCSDYRTSLQADFSNPARIRFAGHYPRTCGERVWPIAYADPASFASRAVQGLWETMGGKLTGQVRLGLLPLAFKPSITFQSSTLAEVLRDMNKFSNNVMAQQLFLSLSLTSSHAASFEASRALMNTWWQNRYGHVADMPAPILENGSGLSRTDRITAFALAHMLQDAFASPFMPELLASLPITGVDGTMRRSKAFMGSAHLKTGTLNNVAARAGYVDAKGKRYVLVAIINSGSTQDIVHASTLFDALIEWVSTQ